MLPSLLLLLLVVSLPDQLHAIDCNLAGTASDNLTTLGAAITEAEAADVSSWVDECTKGSNIVLKNQGVLDLSSLDQSYMDKLFKRNTIFLYHFGVNMIGSKIRKLEMAASGKGFALTVYGGFTVEESPNLEAILIEDSTSITFNFESGAFVLRKNPKLKSFTFPATKKLPFKEVKFNNIIDEATLALLKNKARNSFSDADIQERGECAFLEAVKDVKELNACTSFGGHLRFEPTVTGAVKPTLMMGMDAKLTVVNTGLEKLELTNMTDNATVTGNVKLCHPMFYSASMTGNCPHKCNSPRELATKQCTEVEGDVELGGGPEDETRAQNMVNVVTIRGRLSLNATGLKDLRFLGKLQTIQAGQNPALSVVDNPALLEVLPPSLTSLKSTGTVGPEVVIEGNGVEPSEEQMTAFGKKVGLPYNTSSYAVTLGEGQVASVIGGQSAGEEGGSTTLYLIIGCSVLGVLVVAGAVGGFVYYKRRKQSSKAKKKDELEAEKTQPDETEEEAEERRRKRRRNPNLDHVFDWDDRLVRRYLFYAITVKVKEDDLVYVIEPIKRLESKEEHEGERERKRREIKLWRPDVQICAVKNRWDPQLMDMLREGKVVEVGDNRLYYVDE